MAGFRVQPVASARLDEIYQYTRRTWGDEQAELYIRSMFDKFAAIAARQVQWRPIPAELGVVGWFCRHRHYFIYWRELEGGYIGIATVLHERMHQMPRMKAEFGSEPL